jgi:hypothetical protein
MIDNPATVARLMEQMQAHLPIPAIPSSQLVRMLIDLRRPIRRVGRACYRALQNRVVRWTTPACPGLISGVASDLTKSKAELVAENALLRQQVIVLQRQAKRPSFRHLDRFLLVLFASRARAWEHTLLLI